jgi:hypothetical protein
VVIIKKKVFVSHPFKGEPKLNMIEVDKICKQLDEDGMFVISPLHMFSYKTKDTDRELIMEMCFRLIKMCDEVYIYGDSSGCNRELDYAKKIGKKYQIKY